MSPKEKADAHDADFSTRLAQAMDARALSGGELARRTGFTAQYILSLKSGERGARIPLESARKIASALGVAVEWLLRGEGPRERLSDVYPAHTAPRSRAPSDIFPSRAEAIALLANHVEPEVLAALREHVPESGHDPGREFWIDYAKDLARDLRRIKDDPDFALEFAGDSRSADRAPRSSFAIRAHGSPAKKK